MDKIIASGLQFQGCHGVLPQEKTEAQIFIIDLGLYIDLGKAGISDDLHDTVSYDDVFQAVKRIVEKEHYNLIEALAENIAAAILLRFPVQGVEVTVRKPDAPVKGKFDFFAVSIKRFRASL
ncbi:MAG: dihydroneopterin aldolase [Bacillota bacterium]|nr:dihydroneopterin aldolase [Bacillota bacterium]